MDQIVDHIPWKQNDWFITQGTVQESIEGIPQ